MYIYIIIKILVEIFAQYFNFKINKFFIFFEILIILLYIYMLYYFFLFNKYLFLFGLLLIIIFLFYILINYIFIKQSYLLIKLKKIINEKKQKKIKKFFLKPLICKIIYYGI